MNITLLAAGTRSPDWISTGFEEYRKRLPKEWQLNLNEIQVSKRHKGEPVAKLKQEEGKRMLSQIKPGSKVIALDSRGKNWSTELLAENFKDWQMDTKNIYFLIGGPDGLSDECLQAAHATWSLSKLTFPHFVVRLILAEQIYRAWSVLHNHPYHK